MNGALLSLLTVLISAVFTLQLLWQYAQRRRPHQLVWALAVFFFAAGVACQVAGELNGWTALAYRIWYLSGAVLTAAWLGQGTIYLQGRGWQPDLSMAVLLLASAAAAIAVFRAPVDLTAALSGPAISGQGMPRAIRLLTPFFNIFGTVTLVGGAAKSSWFFLWTGGSNGGAAGTGLIAAGALVVAFGGTLTRFDVPEALALSELVGIGFIYLGFLLTNRRGSMPSLSAAQLRQRRQHLARRGVTLGAGVLLGLVLILPILPWPMGIVTNAQHIYMTEVPVENRGTYLLTEQGVMQLYNWRVEPTRFPEDAPVLEGATLEGVSVVQKVFDAAEEYRLYNLSSGERLRWQTSENGESQLTLFPPPLAPGRYMLIIPNDSMYGGKTWHYFIVR